MNNSLKKTQVNAIRIRKKKIQEAASFLGEKK